ncbi:HelD family protein [Aureibacillus halotolerans]|uniref:DNA helicase-2/ATP-dependent DNA helicase PcrA n=1 Tax=Aureibacillus halotolerans TaxID=1508390 RepID=A0A4R6TTW5_9BACI|nr:3'-5' exonuclease [Aureibacillus halotolerans]TDQ36556.1 DNA helicase-2/ATP-dependent DNA helicase PcrA [Aureibacillus halotolerans]
MTHQEEREYLGHTLTYIQQKKTELVSIPNYTGEDITKLAIEDHRVRTIAALRRAAEEPYFGRIDFTEENGTDKAYYIGKSGIENDKGGDPLVIDWRAPVASLFYGFSGGEELAYYVAPEGIIEGEIQLKRNIVIRQADIQRIVDTFVRGETSSSGGDEFLLYRLGEHKDDRLRDIVSTIQAEQNDIIRKEKNRPLFIQGVAGSGKTTVALHRLAFLLYEYREQLNAKRMIIFAPNAMFLNYISNVLPELGVGDIQQSTFIDWALSQMDVSFPLENEAERLMNVFETSSDEKNEASTLGSLATYKSIDAFATTHAQVSLQQLFDAGEGRHLTVEELANWTVDDGMPLARRKERFLQRVKHWIDEQAKWMDPPQARDFKKTAKQKLRTYSKHWPSTDPLSVYLYYLKEHAPTEWIRISETKTLTRADIAPLLHLHYRLHGIPKEHRFDHTVIDEAQDCSPYQLAVLNEVTRRKSFTVLGDLAQGIYGEEGVQSWSALEEVFGDTDTTLSVMQRSYRSTFEIITFANQFLKQMPGIETLAEPVFRSGNAVEVIKVKAAETFKVLAEWISTMQTKQAETLVILTRSSSEAKVIHQILHQAGQTTTLVSAEDTSYEGGISIMPVYLAKGLEFDAVLMWNVSQANYPEDARHAKLMYVGCTRALHELTLLYDGTPSPLLIESL